MLKTPKTSKNTTHATSHSTTSSKTSPSTKTTGSELEKDSWTNERSQKKENLKFKMLILGLAPKVHQPSTAKNHTKTKKYKTCLWIWTSIKSSKLENRRLKPYRCRDLGVRLTIHELEQGTWSLENRKKGLKTMMTGSQTANLSSHPNPFSPMALLARTLTLLTLKRSSSQLGSASLSEKYNWRTRGGMIE